MTPRNRALVAAAVVGVIVILIAVIALMNDSGNNFDGSTNTSGPNGPENGSGSTAAGTPSSEPGTTAARPTGPTIPVAERGGVHGDPSSAYGQAPSSGPCARWSERFINASKGKVVHITFTVRRTYFSTGVKGQAGYREYPAAIPPPSGLNVAIDPGKSHAIQFQSCTTTARPAAGAALHITAPAVLEWAWDDGATGRGPFP